MQRLWKGVEDDTGGALLMHFLARLIEVAKVPARDPVAFARAVQLYSIHKIKFFRERPERFQSAIRTVVWGIGDCDDKARFIAACLRSIRIPARLKFMHMVLPDGKRLGHVWPQAWLPNQAGVSEWTSLESVREYPLGYDPEARARERGFGVQTFVVGDASGDQVHI